jgi:hypothetical protein
MKRFYHILNLLLLLVLSLLISCVGTVQDAKVDVNSLSEEDKQVIKFGGLEQARAISHDKVELEFTPLGIDDPNLKYLLYINGSPSPIEVSAVALNDSIGGRKIYTVLTLIPNTTYKFVLKLENSVTKARSEKEKEMIVTTFDNKTADFRGVTSLTKVIGLSDTSIIVDWVPAHMDGVIIAKEFDPIYYEVTIIGAGGPQNLNNPNYTGLDRRVIPVPNPLSAQISPMNHSQYTSTIIDGLTPSTKYYVQVRAVNKLWYTFSIDPLVTQIPVDREQNTLFLPIKTDSANGDFDFNVDGLMVSNALGADAFTKVNTFWPSGTGTFTGYKLFLRKHPSSAATSDIILADDKLPIEQMQGIMDGTIVASDANGRFINAATTINSLQVGSLETYEWYQFKIVQCRTAACPVFPLSDPNIGIVSELRAIRVGPSLAPFDGIARIDNPVDPLSLDEIKVSFDPPAMTVGYADKLEVYCLDPDTVGGLPAAYDFDPNPLTTVARAGSTVSKCNGLYLKSEPDLTDKNLTIVGVKSIPAATADAATYCFAVFPAIRYQTEQIPAVGTYPKEDWVVRCVTPEVKTPTVAQFGGLTGVCNPVQDTIALNWTAPTGGIYANYRVYYRTISGSQIFKFSDAVSGDPAYTSISIADGITSQTLTGLRPGTRYRIGILTEIINGATTLYSEFNTAIKDCVTPMPVATFDEWTRVFSVGPKVDGRFPHALAPGNKRVVPDSAKVLEALNVDGIPYEVGVDSIGTIDPLSFLTPPGHYYAGYTPTTFTDDFDGAFGNYQGPSVMASRNGIVSLGWRDMSLDFLNNEFKECQRHPTDPAITTNPACSAVPALRKNRLYGYKVFRSVDNRLSWTDVTGSNGTTGVSLVYARDFQYYKRPNVAATTERMAFFTDYSVQAIYTDPEGRERGRILWYKIVPYFDKKALSVSGGGVTSPNIIKVVLPPPNMALVKREIANRNACIAIGRDAPGDIDKTNAGHYSCAFNGIGSRPKGTPWNMTNQIIDLGGDLLVDRYELGCQYTRGDYTAIPEEGSSFFKRDAVYTGALTDLKDFRGFRTDVDGNDTGDKLVGCTRGSDFRLNLESNWGSSTTSLAPDYKKVVYGDCIGTGTVSIAGSVCADPLKAGVRGYKFPGAFAPGTAFDCTNIVADDPQNFSDRYNVDFRRNLVVQSEFGAVFYHRDTRMVDMLYPTGPGHASAVVNTGWTGKQKQCFINLAAIGGDGTVRARWFPAEDLNRIKNGAGIQNIAKKTMAQVNSDTNLFDAGEYKLPTGSLKTTLRFDDTTLVAKVASANSAKLPPLTGVSQELAQDYCSAYDIEIGVSTDGANFLATSLPTNKRLLRKAESLFAADWPSTANNHAQSYNYTEAKIITIEGTNTAGSCVGSTKMVSSGGLGRNSTITPQSTTYDQGVPTFVGKAHTGSSRYDQFNPALDREHSEKCISEFGIQDMVGNVSEFSSERMFCDYSKDKLWFGKYDAGNPMAQTGIGDETNSIRIADNQSYQRLFWKKLTMYFEKAGGGFREVGPNATGAGAVVSDVVTWPQPNPDSGYCSIVDNVESYALSTSWNRFRDAVDNFYPSTITGGALNTAMIPAGNENLVDRESVNFLRNGDGFFLNFGASNIAPQFKDGNSLGITGTVATPTTQALGPFFNPVVGLPMACKGDSCLQSDDNTRITTPFLAPKVGATTPAITNYPIGNSQVSNIGISDVIHTGNAVYVMRDLSLDPNDYDSQVIDRIEVYLDGSIVMTSKSLSQWWADNPTERTPNQEFSGLNFALPRNTPLIFANGGDFNDIETGKYTSTIITGTEENTKVTVGPGIRCGVMINSD